MGSARPTLPRKEDTFEKKVMKKQKVTYVTRCPTTEVGEKERIVTTMGLKSWLKLADHARGIKN